MLYNKQQVCYIINHSVQTVGWYTLHWFATTYISTYIGCDIIQLNHLFDSTFYRIQSSGLRDVTSAYLTLYMCGLQAKVDMLDNLKEIECAYSLLRSSTGGPSTSPLDSHYESLKTKIEPVDQKSKEFDLINQYTQNTHGKTHSHYTLDVDQVCLSQCYRIFYIIILYYITLFIYIYIIFYTL